MGKAIFKTAVVLGILIAAVVFLSAHQVFAADVPASDAYCARIGANVSPDPDIPGNEANIVKLHARGCFEYMGSWRAMYVQNENTACNIVANLLAQTGMSTKDVIANTKNAGCVQFEDGSWGTAFP